MDRIAELVSSAPAHADDDRIEELWASFDLISAELVRAKRALREGRASEDDVTLLRAEVLSIGSDLAELGESPDLTEPGEEYGPGAEPTLECLAVFQRNVAARPPNEAIGESIAAESPEVALQPHARDRLLAQRRLKPILESARDAEGIEFYRELKSQPLGHGLS